MLKEAEYEFIKELTIMIYVNRYRCVAASLLQSTCRHARLGLKEPDLKELSYSLREVSSSKSKLPVQCNLLTRNPSRVLFKKESDLESNSVYTCLFKKVLDLEPDQDYVSYYLH
jgi:hypothetical protein